MHVFFISPVPIAEPLTSELIDSTVFHNLAPRPIKYQISVPIPNFNAAKFSNFFSFINVTVYLVSQWDKYEIVTQPFKNT